MSVPTRLREIRSKKKSRACLQKYERNAPYLLQKKRGTLQTITKALQIYVFDGKFCLILGFLTRFWPLFGLGAFSAISFLY